ncbi:MAG: alpha/beta hydrolase [Thermomonas sp.]|uniref:esterase/lipase family protein n=1 Tax=Thermomonas sp. TaxID=1971895 RepID=UPI001ED4AE00|nr:alpha/beta fold hydrolase [Thermomonas sp.]MBV2210018.1 alpha/beta hydrolase [Thermomonas sp.]
MGKVQPDVLLVHGLLNASWWLWPMARLLRQQGFTPQLFGYSSIFENPNVAVAQLQQQLEKTPVRYVLGHSLGGLIALEALRQKPTLPAERVVCLGSPLRGSRTAAALATHPVLKSALGCSAHLLKEGVASWSGAASVGVVAGDLARGMGRVFADFSEASDGTVAVSETQLPGIADHCLVHASHTGLVLSQAAANQAAHFMRHGQFER